MTLHILVWTYRIIFSLNLLSCLFQFSCFKLHWYSWFSCLRSFNLFFNYLRIDIFLLNRFYFSSLRSLYCFNMTLGFVLSQWLRFLSKFFNSQLSLRCLSSLLFLLNCFFFILCESFWIALYSWYWWLLLIEIARLRENIIFKLNIHRFFIVLMHFNYIWVILTYVFLLN